MSSLTPRQQRLLDALDELRDTLQDDYPVLSFEHRQNIHLFLVELERVLQDILAIPWNHQS